MWSLLFSPFFNYTDKHAPAHPGTCTHTQPHSPRVQFGGSNWGPKLLCRVMGKEPATNSNPKTSLGEIQKGQMKNTEEVNHKIKQKGVFFSPKMWYIMSAAPCSNSVFSFFFFAQIPIWPIWPSRHLMFLNTRKTLLKFWVLNVFSPTNIHKFIILSTYASHFDEFSNFLTKLLSTQETDRKAGGDKMYDLTEQKGVECEGWRLCPVYRSSCFSSQWAE